MSVFITGSSGYIGTQLCKRYEEESAVDEIVGLDLVPPKQAFSKLIFYRQDCNSDLTAIFENHKIDTIIHLVFILDPIHDSEKMYRVNVGSMENILAYAEKYGTRRLVVTSSYTAYGAHPDNPRWLMEDQPLRGNTDFQYARDKTIVEERLRSFAEKRPEVEIIIARPAMVVGPSLGNFISRYLSKSWVPLVKDSQVEIQFIHEEDASDALYHLATEAPSGAYSLGPPDTIHPAEAAKIMGGKPVGFRPGVLRFFTALGWTLRLRFLSEAPGSMISFMQYRCVVDGSKIERETRFRYKYSSADAIRAFAHVYHGQ